MRKAYMMKCGHAANATNGKGNPCCVICSGINKGADEIDETPPNLDRRTAMCTYCRKESSSAIELPFFRYRPDRDKDEYYCGRKGWD